MPTTTTTNEGRRLRIAREQLGVSRVQLAAMSGYSPAHIAQIEDGYTPRRGVAIATISAVLDQLTLSENEQRPGGDRGVEQTSDEGAQNAHPE